MALGGKRPGSGSKPGSRNGLKAQGGRAWIRATVDTPKRREQFVKALDRALRGPNALEAVQAYLRAFEHGYGRPPQALDVVVNDGGPIVHRITFGSTALAPGGDTRVSSTAPVPGADDGLGGTD